MTTAESAGRLPLQPDARVGIVAGGGKLPGEVADALAAQGRRPFILAVQGETDAGAGLDRHEHETMAIEEIGSLVSVMRRHGVTHVVLAGEIGRRPRLGAMRFNAGLLAMAPFALMALARGDDGLLKAVVRSFEARGLRVIGAHEVVPELVAVEGLWTRKGPDPADRRDTEAAYAAARAIGALDIGQGAVAIGGRVIAMEGIEGTDGMLERVRDLRSHGRIAGRQGGVLVKCFKPGQEIRADMPAIGPRTVQGAHEAGLRGIAVEAGRTLVLDGPELVALANGLGLFVLGLPRKDAAHGG